MFIQTQIFADRFRFFIIYYIVNNHFHLRGVSGLHRVGGNDPLLLLIGYMDSRQEEEYEEAKN